MKAKTIITLIAAMSMLQSGVSAAEVTTYGQSDTDNPYFVEKESIITLDANGGWVGSGCIGTENKIEITTKKGRIKLPIPYRNSDYEFEGWYTEDGEKVSSDTEYYVSTTIYARWRIIGERMIIFASDGGSDVRPITAQYGETVNIETQIPIKDGYIFKGWYTDPITKENRVSKITVEDNVTVYAKWERTEKSVDYSYVGADNMYLTDDEITVRKEASMHEPKLTFESEQIKRLIQLLERMLKTTK